MELFTVDQLREKYPKYKDSTDEEISEKYLTHINKVRDYENESPANYYSFIRVVNPNSPDSNLQKYKSNLDPDLINEKSDGQHAYDVFKKLNDSTIDYVIGLQPDNPDRNVTLDDGLKYFIDLKYDDLVTVSSDGSRNGALRITRASHIKSGYVSRRVGTILDNCTNIHSKQDLLNAEKNINERVY